MAGEGIAALFIKLVNRGSSSTEEGLTLSTRPPTLFQVKAGDTLIASADTERENNTGGWITEKEILALRDGIYRVRFDMKGSGAINSRARVTRSGTTVGSTYTNNTGVYINYSQDLNFAAGDIIGLQTEDPGAGSTFCRNFRLHGEKTLDLADVVLD
jgi:hypothetical protein